MKRTMKKQVSIPILVVVAAIIVGLVVGNFYAAKYAPIITTFLGQKNYKVTETNVDEESTYFSKSYASQEERLAADSVAGVKAASEGFVMLKNDNEALPLSSGNNVTLFGVGSASILYGGGGSGAVDTSTVPTLKSALEASGFNVNEVMWNFYTEGAAAKIRMDVADIAGTGRYVIHEASTDMFSDTEVNSFENYRDAAIVTFSRSGSESSDVPVSYDESYLEPMDIEGYVGAFHSDPLDSKEDLGRHYLELTNHEEKLLEYVSQKFDKVIVIINAGNTMELSFLDEAKYGVDACIWIGNPGQDGLYGLGQILNGSVNPSGKTVDTYAYDPTQAPAVVNFGDSTMTGAEEELFSKYVVYQEGIYVGYKYYETRYEDTMLGQGNAESMAGASNGNTAWNYDTEVQFPFGYGLSYTQFDETLISTVENENEITFEVEVTNTGDVAGKQVVEIYGQSPYTDYDRANGVEKSALELVGFEKTDILEPGQSQTVAITVDKDQMKSYDAYGKGTYILESGDYYFAVGTDAHDAINNILKLKGNETSGDASLATMISFKETDCSNSVYTGYQITNQFDDTDVKSFDSGFTYLSRSDWENTFPTKYEMVATEEMIAALAIQEGIDDPDAQKPTTDADNGLTLAMMIGLDADDPAWDSLLDQMSAEEMYNLVRVGGYQTQTVNSVSAPATVDVDGPAYVGNAGTTGVMLVEPTYAWPSEVVLASTWNVDILTNMGQLIGEDCLAQGDLNFAGWYAPAMNIHRCSFSGRNFEYYSEDDFLSSECAAATVKGARSKGVITYAKHFALNDQETNRTTINTFANEQSIRELYLGAFEGCIADDGENQGTLGIMASMNRIGLRWSGNHYGLMTNILRNEWGYDGILITDQASYPQAFPALAIRGGLENGVDLWLNSGTDNWQIEGYTNNATVLTQLRTASKHILYAVANSLAMNGISSSARVVHTLAQWQYWLIILDVVLGILMIIAIVYVVRKTVWKKDMVTIESTHSN